MKLNLETVRKAIRPYIMSTRPRATRSQNSIVHDFARSFMNVILLLHKNHCNGQYHASVLTMWVFVKCDCYNQRVYHLVEHTTDSSHCSQTKQSPKQLTPQTVREFKRKQKKTKKSANVSSPKNVVNAVNKHNLCIHIFTLSLPALNLTQFINFFHVHW